MTHYSVYEDKQKRVRIPLKADGQPDYANKESWYIRGFKDRYDLSVPANRCLLLGEPEPGYHCQGFRPADDDGKPMVQIGLNTGVFRTGGNKLRVFLPPGTISLGLNIHYNSGHGGIKVLYRLDRPTAPRDTPTILGADDNPLETLYWIAASEMCIDATVAPRTNFVQLAIYSQTVKPSTWGRWLYLDFPGVTERQAWTLFKVIEITARVRLKPFEQWFKGSPGWGWDNKGNPVTDPGVIFLPVVSSVGLDPPAYFRDVAVWLQGEPIDKFSNPAMAGKVAQYDFEHDELWIPPGRKIKVKNIRVLQFCLNGECYP